MQRRDSAVGVRTAAGWHPPRPQRPSFGIWRHRPSSIPSSCSTGTRGSIGQRSSIRRVAGLSSAKRPQTVSGRWRGCARELSLHIRGDRVTVAFAPDGESLFSAGAGVVRHWALNPERPFDSRVILELPAPVYFDVSPDGRSLLTGDFAGGVKIIPLDDSPKRSLKGFPFGEAIRDVSFSPSGRLVAAGAGALRAEDAVTRVWDLATGNAQTLDAGDGQMILDLEFVGEDRLATTGYGGLRLWDLSTGTSTLLSQDGIFKVSYGARDDVLLAAPVVGAGANLLRFDLSSGRVQEIPGRSGGGCPTGIRPRWSDRGLRCRPRQNPGGSG